MANLRYRIPGNTPVSKEGGFVKTELSADLNGFIVSNFDQSSWYILEENGVEVARDIEVPTVISKEEYLQQATTYIHRLKKIDNSKAILSRVKKVKHNNDSHWFEILCAKYPNAFVYELKSDLLGHWIGATPEVLVEINDGEGKTMSLAGTLPVNGVEDWSEKEFVEQQLVTSFIENNLKPFTSKLKVEARKELNTGVVRHLLNEFSFTIKEDNLLPMIQQLHPTPAVSGFPRKDAMQIIEEIESHNRKLYAGVIGHYSTTKSNLFVNLRSCQIIGEDAYLYVGGGLTKDSDPEKEWIETENKAKTLLNILQNS